MRENAKFTATVDFPTPPLQLETAIIFFTCYKPAFLLGFPLGLTASSDFKAYSS